MRGADAALLAFSSGKEVLRLKRQATCKRLPGLQCASSCTLITCQPLRKRESPHHVNGCNAARIQLHSRPRSARVLPKVSRLRELLTKSRPRRKKSSSQDATISRFRVIRAHARERGRNYSPIPQGRAFLSGRGLPFSDRHFSNTTREEARV